MVSGGAALARLGGIAGLVYVVLMIPCYAVGYPDALTSGAGSREAIDYYGGGLGGFLFFNGVLVIFAAFFFALFLGALHGALRRAEGEPGMLSSVALAGGVMYLALLGAGIAVEISFPAVATRFENFEADVRLIFLSLGLSAWLYHFCQVGTAALVGATSLVALGSGILPRWLALTGLAVALLALLHFLLPLLASLVGLLWVAAVSILLLTGSPGARAFPALGRR